MGAPPPTRMAPMHTCTEERRLMLMGVQCYDTQARIGLSGESPAQAGTPKAQIPPGNAQAQERQTAEGATSAGLLESGGFDCFHPPKASGAERQRLLANDVAKLRTPGKALYGCMLNERGGVIDDTIVYYLSDSWFRAVVNAGTRDKDLAWIRRHAPGFGVEVSERTDLAMLAIQGPEGRAKAAQLLAAADAGAALALPTFVGREIGGWFVARTGYTGADGFEIMMPAADAVPAWRQLNSFGVASCGLGARDTLRHEAGMNLYVNDMDEGPQPFESGVRWTAAMEPPERLLIGRGARQP